MSPPAIAVAAVSKRYGRTLALDHIDFTVPQGEMFALLGPNGAGKTTLLHIMCTILAPDAGSVHLFGTDIAAHATRARRQMGVVFQEPSLDDRLTVWENLEFHGLVFGVPAALRRHRIAQMLELVELSDWRERLVRTLSSGMKRRLEIARALIHDSRLLFLDEPTVGLDAQSRERIWQYLARLRGERELTVLVTTHYIDEVDACDRVCVIDQGKILALDTPAALKSARGEQLLRVVVRTEADAEAIAAAYPEQTTRRGQELVIRSPGDVFADSFLALHGAKLRRLTVEEPSLESVFLALTGRGLRDQEASPRDRTLAFGKRGGEHTR